MIAAVVLTVAQASRACADCALSKQKVVLCTPHADEERAAFGAMRKPLVSKSDDERIAALETLARLTTAHPNAPSPAVARRIAEALEDRSQAVRSRVVELLGPPQHALVCLEALLDAMKRAEKDLQQLVDDEQEMQAKRYDARGDAAEELAADLRAHAVRQESLLAWRRALVTQLALFADERVVTLLCEVSAQPVLALAASSRERDVLERWQAYMSAVEALPAAMDVNAALVRLGSRPAIQRVIENLVALKREIGELSDLPSVGPYGPIGMKNRMEAMHRELTAARDRTSKEIGASLAAKSVGAPLPEHAWLEPLLAWLLENAEYFPAELPGVRSPAW
jgi:hypothetical protein